MIDCNLCRDQRRNGASSMISVPFLPTLMLSPETVTTLDSTMHELIGFVYSHRHVFSWISLDDDETVLRHAYQEGFDEEAFAESEPWLQEHCPSFTRLGPLIGIQDDDEAFAFKIRFG